MTPDKWLELAAKHITNPDELTDDELNQLRTNYTIWGQAAEVFNQNNKANQARRITTILRGAACSDDVWEMVKSGNVVEGVADENQVREIREAHLEFLAVVDKIRAARVHRQFLKSFDENFQAENGNLSPEVQDMIWKTKAERLYKAIEDHRRAHVLANKQPNGLDFALWQEANLDEFHPSVHAGLQQNGFIAFRE